MSDNIKLCNLLHDNAKKMIAERKKFFQERFQKNVNYPFQFVKEHKQEIKKAIYSYAREQTFSEKHALMIEFNNLVDRINSNGILTTKLELQSINSTFFLLALIDFGIDEGVLIFPFYECGSKVDAFSIVWGEPEFEYHYYGKVVKHTLNKYNMKISDHIDIFRIAPIIEKYSYNPYKYESEEDD